MDVLEWSSCQRVHFHEAKEQWGDPLAYEQSWLFVCQTLRRGGWICRDSDGWMAVARDYLGPGRHAVVVPMSSNLCRFLESGLRELRARGIVPSVVKHLTYEVANSLISTGRFTELQHPEITSSIFLDDLSEDRLPQVLAKVSAEHWTTADRLHRQWVPLVPTHPGGAEFRHQLWRFLRTYPERGASLTLQTIGAAEATDINRALRNWSNSLRNRLQRAGQPRVRDFSRCFLDPVQAAIDYARHDNGDTVGQIVAVENEPSSLWIGTRISRECVAVNVLLADTTVKSLSYYTVYLACHLAHQLGAGCVNLGGSELESLFRFKMRAAGVASIGQLTTRRVCDLKMLDHGSL